MQYLYYPGCTLYTKAKELDRGARLAAEQLGIRLVEMPAWTCCGAIYNTNSDDLAAQLGPVRNLARASQLGKKLVTLCAACHNVLKRANASLADPEQAERSRRLLDYVEERYDPRLAVVHYLELLRDDVGWNEIREKVRRPLAGLKVASYYGCLMSRPHEVMAMGSPTDPKLLDELMATLFAEPVEFDFKTKCCGGYLVVSERETAAKCTRRIVENARQSGADLLVTSCPLCRYNIDALQEEMKGHDPDYRPLPILYFTKLLGLALGLDIRDLALDYARVDARPVLERHGLM